MRWAEKVFDAFMYPLEAVALRRRRRHRMSDLSGKVLEIGAGTGANLHHYNLDRVDQLHLSDLDITVRARDGASDERTEYHFHEADVHALPFEDNTFDHVVFTLVFCSVREPARGLAEVFRVLKPGGSLIFIEHVKPDRGFFRPAVEALNPAWKAFNGECNINRDTVSAIRTAGFTIGDLRHGGGGLLVDGVALKPVETG